MFTERIKTLLDLSGATSADIAAYAGFDRTNISRLKTGRRIPAPDSSTSYKLIEGIYLYFDSQNMLQRLCDCIGADINGSAIMIKDGIRAYLYADYEEDYFHSKEKRNSKKLEESMHRAQTFGERLNLLMDLTGLTNIQLSRITHTDPSLISRYRNGVRTPASNPALSAGISSILYDRIIKAGKESELSKAMNMPIPELDDEEFYMWLYGKSEHFDDYISSAEGLLGIFDSFTAPSYPASLIPAGDDYAPPVTDNGDEDLYYGIEGLRQAVIRFLSAALRSHATDMYLYSDEDQSWLTGDPEFISKWASLMYACVSGGTHIHIIHNVDRDLKEMNDAIKSWLPLYMSGMIEAFYCRRHRNSRFSHTFFLIPGMACIRSFDVSSASTERIYHYYTEQRALNVCRTSFDALLDVSSPLMKPLPSSVYPENSDMILIRNSLSIATMSRELAESYDDPGLMNIWEKTHYAFLDKLETDLVCECAPLADAKGVSKQYSKHIECIVHLLNSYSNYRFYPVPEPPFRNIDFLISDNITQITPAIRPGQSFSFVHTSMCMAFKSYAEALMDKWRIDRNTLSRLLEERYL